MEETEGTALDMTILQPMLPNPPQVNPRPPAPPPTIPPPACPRCDSLNTKFCYYNNYSLTQPRYYCKGCRRYWTHGGTLRNVPVGGSARRRRNNRSSSSSGSGSVGMMQPITFGQPQMNRHNGFPNTVVNPYMAQHQPAPQFYQMMGNGRETINMDPMFMQQPPPYPQFHFDNFNFWNGGSNNNIGGGAADDWSF